MNIGRFVEYGGLEIPLDEAMLVCAFSKKLDERDAINLLLMGAEYIRVLQCALRLLEAQDHLVCLSESGRREAMKVIEDDPGILSQALDRLYRD